MPPRIYESPHRHLAPAPYTNAFTFAFPPATYDTYPPSKPAFIDAKSGFTVTRGDVRRLALELGHGLANVLPRLVRPGWDGQLKRGDAVVLFSPNSIAFVLAVYGALAAGLVVSPANTTYTPRELLHQFRDSSARAVIAHPALVPVALQTLVLAGFSEQEARARIIVCDFRGLSGVEAEKEKQLVTMEDLLSKGALEQEARFDGPDADETVFLCYSSGTTGKPKGVMTTHKNIIAVCRMITGGGAVGVPGNWFETHAAVLPMFHIFALNNLLFHAPWCADSIVVIERFDPVQFPAAIERYKITIAIIVPPIVLALTRHPAVDKFDLRSLRTVVCGAAPLGAALAREFRERMLKRGVDVAVSQGYGLTETSPTIAVLARDWTSKKYGSTGQLLPLLEARLIADNDEDAPEGGPGELWVRGPSIMKGYLNNEAATRDVITPDGWFKTGDIAIRDSDGFYTIVDRKKELIKYKGFQVPPAELESVLLQHPDIVDAGVIGIEDKVEATELPRAYVVHAKPATLKTDADKAAFAASVQVWIQAHVAKHKYLRGGCVVIDAIPKSAAGKILRKDLRERAAKELAVAGGLEKAKL